MRYLLLIYGCERPEEASAAEAKRAAVQAYYQHLRERGVFLAADPLCETDTATTVRIRDGETLITDGPFAETVEQLGGYFLVDCRDATEAVELAARCPMAAEGSVEVRPILELPEVSGAGR